LGTSRIDSQAQPAPACQRIAIGIEYDGTAYSGWQDQPHAPSVQRCINDALAYVAAAKIDCVGAGRTDAGVHASGQVAHFDTPVKRSERSWLMGLNSRLPDDINILWVQPVSSEFHARFSAVSRSYRYEILNRPVRSALSRKRRWWLHQSLDLGRMQTAAAYLLGEHDFSAFRASACQAHSPVRTMSQLDITRSDDRIVVECSANAFLHHMVRNIVGSLVRIGSGEAEPEWLVELLEGRDRKLSGVTAPAHGLTLTRVDYPPDLLQVSVASLG
jgi:tRNA pseudouridine38-40 synthase